MQGLLSNSALFWAPEKAGGVSAKCPPLPVPEKKVKGQKALPSAPFVNPPASKRRTRRTIPSKTTPLGVGDW